MLKSRPNEYAATGVGLAQGSFRNKSPKNFSILSQSLPGNAPILRNNPDEASQRTKRSRRGEYTKDKKKQTSLTMQWLNDNYVISEGVCLPRCILYSHYLNFCQSFNFDPACAATFGKMIRQKFPGITTRRLGTRGHSKYHYYGIGIRETSPYYHAVYSSKGLTRFSSSIPNEMKQMNFPRDPFTASTYLEEYPDISKIVLAPSYGFEKHQIDDLLVRHRNNCHNIISAALNRNFNDVRVLVTQFWHSLPQTSRRLLDIEMIVDVVCLGESILHKDLTDILVPVSKEDVTERTLEEIRFVAKNWEEWEMAATVGISQLLQKKRLPLIHQFSQSLKRQSSFLHLAQTLHNLLTDSDKVAAMIRDIAEVDLSSIGSQAFYANAESEGQDNELNSELLKDLKDLLHRNVPLEKYIAWLDGIVEQKVIKPSKQNGRSTKKRAQDFLLKWSFFGARVMHNLTLNNAASFRSFHMLRMLFDEYVLYGVETQFNNEKDQELATAVEKHLKRQARDSMHYYSNVNPVPAKRWSPVPTKSASSFPFEEDISSPARSTVINQGLALPRSYPALMNIHNSQSLSAQAMPPQYEVYFPPPNYNPGVQRQFHAGRYNNCDTMLGSEQTSGSCIRTNGRSGLPDSSPASYICDGEQVFASLDSFPSADAFTSCVLPENSSNLHLDINRTETEVQFPHQDNHSASVNQYVPVISIAGNVNGMAGSSAVTQPRLSTPAVGNNDGNLTPTTAIDPVTVSPETSKSQSPDIRMLDCYERFSDMEQCNGRRDIEQEYRSQSSIASCTNGKSMQEGSSYAGERSQMVSTSNTMDLIAIGNHSDPLSLLAASTGEGCSFRGCTY